MKNISKTPSMSEVINTVIENRLLDLHTAIPAIVRSFDSSNNTVSVIPAIRRQYNDGIKELPILNDIPVMFPQSQDSIISFPLKQNDEVLLVFAERSVDIWKRDGGVVNPDSKTTRKFDLSDGFALPIGRGQSVDPSKLQVKNNNGIISIDANSKFFIGNTTDELLSILSDLTDVLKTIATDVTTTVTGTCPSGGGPLINGTGTGTGTLQSSIVNDINDIKTRLGTIKQ